MSADEHVSKYQFHRHEYGKLGDIYKVYRGDQEVADMTVHHYREAPGENLGGKSRVVGFTVAQGHRAVAPTLMGLAKIRADSRDAKLVPSSDLSKHSSKLIQGLQSRGLVTDSASTEVGNRIDFDTPSRVPPEERMGQRLHTEEVDRSRRYIRNLAKNRPKRR